MKKLLLILALAPFFLNAQETSISAGSYEACGGFIVDSGLTAGDYGGNENFTMVVCPPDGEEVVTLYWNLFAVGTGDTMSIYDGDSDAAPLIGTYTGFELQAQEIFGSEDNPTGCLTLVWTSDNDGINGNFTAEVSCGYPCERPEAIIVSETDAPVLICPGEEVFFDGSNTTVADGFEIEQWTWDFDDGDPVDGGSAESHVYNEPGIYRVQLFVIDGNDCNNTNLTDFQIYVSNDPNFNNMPDDIEICVGLEFDLTGAVEGVPVVDAPDANLGGELFIPDDQEQCFESQIVFTEFDPGTIVDSPDDIDSFFINFEHSFMGDLTISFICPNGQSMAVHQQGGGGTYLGEPVDNDGTPNAQGVGYDYFWSPDATNGTWVDEAGFGTLPEGVYSSVQPWTLLEGCPLNGTWAVEICDSWGSDNGFIFDWTVNFDPSNFPEALTFTPVFEPDCSGTSWEGPSIIDESEDCNTAVVLADNLGNLTYEYTATNNFGCTYTYPIDVEVVEPPVATTAGSVWFCGSGLNLTAGVEQPEPGTTYSYSWENADLLTNPDTQSPTLNELGQPTEFVVTVWPSDIPGCESEATLFVDIPPSPTIFDPYDVDICTGDVIPITAPSQPDGFDWIYTWEMLDVDTILPTGNQLEVDMEGSYTLTISMVEPCVQSISSTVLVEEAVCELGDIPNVFSPNGDIVNDSFFIEGLQGFPNSTLQVYNRWGTLVFESDNYQNNWSPAAEDLSDGTYYFILVVAFPNNPETFTGEVTVLRK